jgi:hypothetical protein
MRYCLILVLASVVQVCAIGQQHGTFACRATQGHLWQGTSSIVSEQFRITVMPAYLDVELNWELNAGGYPKPDSFTNALEIVGNLNLAQDASVIGMLLWNGDTLLQAKLKPVNVAHQQYEAVVDRNAQVPPRPRDPVIFEYGWGKDNYDISVFPVSWGSTRKMRLRYLIPAINMNGIAKIPYPHSFAYQNSKITVLRGPGVGSFAIEGNGTTNALVTQDSISFTSYDAVYQNVQMIRPILTETSGRSTIYTAAFETPNFRGSMAQVIGLPATEILNKAGAKEDFVIVWRWNHPEVMDTYRWQLAKQAAVMKAFCAALDQSRKRAALIVDIQGRERILFDLSTKGSSTFTRMAQFLDSLAAMVAPQPTGNYPPSFTPQQKDSIATESVRQFTVSLAIAMSLFDTQAGHLRYVVIATAGPHWVTDTRQPIVTTTDDGTMVMPLCNVVAAQNLTGVDVSSLRDLYWPGMNLPAIANVSPAQTFNVTALITDGTGSVSRTYSAQQGAASDYGSASYYYVGYTSPHLDLKLYSSTMLRPVVHWTVDLQGKTVATYEESPTFVPLFDGLQFARVLAGSGQLQALDGTLPTPLSETFGFVDQQHALLALEQDVMSPSDQQLYRISGVPPLSPDDITTIPKDVVDESQSNPGSTAVQPRADKHVPAVNDVTVALTGSNLVLHLPDYLRAGCREVRIQVYTASGRLVATLVIPIGSSSTVQAALPAAFARSGQALILHIQVGGQNFVRRVLVK